MAEMELWEQKDRASLDIRIFVRYCLLRQHTINVLQRQIVMGLPVGFPRSQSILSMSGAEMSACPTPL